MTSIAIVGADGAGKTTLARALEARYPGEVTYLYMGANPSSSEVSLPTTRVVHWLKVREVSRSSSDVSPVEAEQLLHGVEYRRDSRGKIWAAARLVNRIAEHSLRQAVSWAHQLKGRIVVYDRHPLFDSFPAAGRPSRLSDRLHLWFLRYLYPKPSFVIYLDAAPEVLLGRKQEVPAEYLARRRQAFLRLGAETAHFQLIDASMPADTVYAMAEAMITKTVAARTRRCGQASGGEPR